MLLQVSAAGLKLTSVALDTNPVSGRTLVRCLQRATRSDHQNRGDLAILHIVMQPRWNLLYTAKAMERDPELQLQAPPPRPPPATIVVPHKQQDLTWLYATIGALVGLFTLTSAPRRLPVQFLRLRLPVLTACVVQRRDAPRAATAHSHSALHRCRSSPVCWVTRACVESSNAQPEGSLGGRVSQSSAASFTR